MDEVADKIAACLLKAEASYGGGGAKVRLPGWERFYAWRLLGSPDLEAALGTPSITTLTAALTRADALYRQIPRPESWAMFYARELLSGVKAS
jgi:hypothetical protein